MRAVLAVSSFLVLAACTGAPPNDAAGVGFGDYNAYITEQRARDQAARSGASLPSGQQAPLTVLPPNELVYARPEATQPVPLPAPAPAPAPAPTTTVQTAPAGSSVAADTLAAISDRPAELSDEQDFGAVSERQTIESDAERLQRQREQFEVIAPTAVPSRPIPNTSNIVAYALSTNHAVGTQLYGRNPLFQRSRYVRACNQYQTADLAQEAFLSAGGPASDRMGMDPDGDGYACTWDPSPYRRAAGN